VALLAPLHHRNFRLFFGGQLISLIGTWMQTVGQAWLVLDLTNSAFLLGVISALQWSPALLLSLPAGVVADRVPKRTLIIITQTLLLLLALILGVLAVTGLVRFWHVALLAGLLGMVNAFDVPARQAFIVEMVGGTDDLTGAVALNSSIFNSARLIGPGLAGLVIAEWGVGIAFLANAASYIAVIAALGAMRMPSRIRVTPGVGFLMHIAEGVQFVRRSPSVLSVLMTLAVLSVFTMNFNVFVPVLARQRLHLPASGFGFLMAAQGGGALLGALLVAATSAGGPRRGYLLRGSLLLCTATIALSAASRPAPAGVLLFLAGVGMILFTATANSSVQMETPDDLRGRVMSIYALIFTGAGPFGALMMGGLVGVWGLPPSLILAGGVGLAGTIAVQALVRGQNGSQRASESLTRPGTAPVGGYGDTTRPEGRDGGTSRA
jgi:MFS family permease